MPALVESEEEEEEDTESKDPLPEKLQNSMVTEEDFLEIKCFVCLGQLRKHKHNFPLLILLFLSFFYCSELQQPRTILGVSSQ